MYRELTVSIPDDPRFEKMLLSIVRDMNNRYRESKERERERERSSLLSSSPIPLLSIYISKEKDKEKEKKEIPYSILSTLSKDIYLGIPDLETLKSYVIYMDFADRFDAVAFFNYMEKREWRGADGEVIQNWAKTVCSSYEKGKFKGYTPKPQKPKDLPYSLYGEAKYFEI